MKLYIERHSEEMLRKALTSGSHALIISGEQGIGLKTISESLLKDSKRVYQIVLPEKDEKVDIDKGSIGVQVIRRLYDSTKTRQPEGRVIIIDYAERMNTVAQNAFLKLLEEPTENTQFILLTHDTSLFLPTITSRSQTVALKRITQEQSNKLLDDLKVTDAVKRTRLLFIAQGLPAELTRLASDEKTFQKRATIVKDARNYITGSPYEKLQIAVKYKNDRDDALTLLSDASKMLQATLAQGGQTASLKTLERLQQLHQRISEQGNIRLQLSAAA